MIEELISLASFFGIVILILLIVLLMIFAISFTDIFFMFVPAGQLRIVMKGRSFHRAVANVPGYTLDTSTGVLKELALNESDPNQTFLSRLFGVYWVGFWPIYTTFKYPFKWYKLVFEDTENKERFKVIPRDRIVNSLFFRYAYPMITETTEIKGNLPYRIYVVATIEACDAEKALFKILPSGSWLVQAEAFILDSVRKYASNKDIDELRQSITKTSDTASKDARFEETIKKVNGTLKNKKGLKALFGIQLAAIKMIDIKLVNQQVTDDINSLDAAVTAQAVAKEKAKAIFERAQGEAKAVRIKAEAAAFEIDQLAEANARRIERVLKPATALPGGTAILIAEADRDAVIGSKATTLVRGGSPPAIMINPEPKPSDSH